MQLPGTRVGKSLTEFPHVFCASRASSAMANASGAGTWWVSAPLGWSGWCTCVGYLTRMVRVLEVRAV
jgi:hypothetical protein